MVRKVLMIAVGLALTPAKASELPSFEIDGKASTTVDFLSEDARLVFDVKKCQISVEAKVKFTPEHNGIPILDLVPEPAFIELDGEALRAADFPQVQDPEGVTEMRAVLRELAAGSLHEAVFRYRLGRDTITCKSGGLKFEFAMTDLKGRGYLERYLPANFEFDTFPLRLKLLANQLDAVVSANGVVPAIDQNSFEISYPDDFSASSFYLYFSTLKPKVFHTVLHGIEKEIPLTLISGEGVGFEKAIQTLERALSDFETRFGPYPHAEIHGNLAKKGGMEYAGAFVGGPLSLRHEFLHSWFGRSVRPKDGNAEWIDEAIAVWEQGAASHCWDIPMGLPRLSGFPAYKRDTPKAAYKQGAALMGCLNKAARDLGGLDTILKQLSSEYAHQPMTTEEFEKFLESRLGVQVHELFRKWIYGVKEFDPALPVGF